METDRPFVIANIQTCMNRLIILLSISGDTIQEAGYFSGEVNGRVHIGNKALPVLGITSCQVEKVGDMVGTEDRSSRIEIRHNLPRLPRTFHPKSQLPILLPQILKTDRYLGELPFLSPPTA